VRGRAAQLPRDIGVTGRTPSPSPPSGFTDETESVDGDATLLSSFVVCDVV
jgi:hypothetical protein